MRCPRGDTSWQQFQSASQATRTGLDRRRLHHTTDPGSEVLRGADEHAGRQGSTFRALYRAEEEERHARAGFTKEHIQISKLQRGAPEHAGGKFRALHKAEEERTTGACFTKWRTQVTEVSRAPPEHAGPP